MASNWRWFSTEREINDIKGLVSTNPQEASNPFCVDAQNQYYFWDETWTSLAGPFPTATEAFKACAEYCKTI